MRRYFLYRCLWVLPTLLIVSWICFATVQLIPGGPVDQALSEWRLNSAFSSQLEIERERAFLNNQYGFDLPVWARYTAWVSKLAHGDLGFSEHRHAYVSDLLARALPATLWLGASAFFFSHVLALLFGLFQARHYRSRADRWLGGVLAAMYSVPSFALALCLTLVLGILSAEFTPLDALNPIYGDYRLSAAGTWRWIAHSILPLICYLAALVPPLTAIVRDRLLSESREPYAISAKARGASDGRILSRHLLPSAWISLVQGWGAWATLFLTGSVVIESIFGIPGVGRLGYEAAMARDYATLIAIIMLGAVGQIVGNLAADLVHTHLDPRVRPE